jgi:hypothetical protein
VWVCVQFAWLLAHVQMRGREISTAVLPAAEASLILLWEHVNFSKIHPVAQHLSPKLPPQFRRIP